VIFSSINFIMRDSRSYGTIPNEVYQLMPKSFQRRQQFPTFLMVVILIFVSFFSFTAFHTSYISEDFQLTSTSVERRTFGAYPEELGIKAEWFHPSKHFFSKRRLIESGLMLEEDQIPEEFDWTDYMDFIVKDQGHESTCWSFSSTATAEAAHWMTGNDMPRLSEQQILDCVSSVENEDGKWCVGADCGYLGNDAGSGGTGGWAEDAMQYWSKHGFVDAVLYPYQYGICKNRQYLPPDVEYSHKNLRANCEAMEGCRWNEENADELKPQDFYRHLGKQMCENTRPHVGPCRTDLKTSGAISGIVLVSYDPRIKAIRSSGMNEDVMKEALVKLGPLSIQANANPMMGYTSGIIDLDELQCDQTDLDHVLQLVGYGTENGVDYWKIRNSWGPFWGEKGYVRVKRGANVCGVAANVFGAYV